MIVDDHVDDAAVGPDEFVLGMSVLWPLGDVVGLEMYVVSWNGAGTARAIGVWRSESDRWRPPSISRRAGIGTADYLQSKVR
ncbi:hypothetical protein N806_19450 [Rhodococcus sp. P27]|nr:hypothetical protein N806_19450 [Rhodococcus sp. P27]